MSSSQRRSTTRESEPKKLTDEQRKAAEKRGEFVREPTTFRQWIRKDGSTQYVPEKDRYHLYISHACPWAHRCHTMIVLKGLQDVISVSSVGPHMLDKGWEFTSDFPDALGTRSHLRELYLEQDRKYSGRITVPVLYDKKTKTIVNNESSEIIRMLNSEFSEFAKGKHDFYPKELRAEIDHVNEFVFPMINNGVYRAGFAKSQEAYEEACREVFEGLQRAEDILKRSKYLTGDTLTEADIRLWTTLVRFDAVYFVHFKCNVQRIQDYPNLQRLLETIYNMPGIAETVRMRYIKEHYYYSHASVNPHRIVPLGMRLPWLKPESDRM